MRGNRNQSRHEAAREADCIAEIVEPARPLQPLCKAAQEVSGPVLVVAAVGYCADMMDRSLLPS